jgi:hypothetical protein
MSKKFGVRVIHYVRVIYKKYSNTVNSVCFTDGPLFPNKVSIKCIAVIFAVKRTATVPGRIRLLIVLLAATCQ